MVMVTVAKYEYSGTPCSWYSKCNLIWSSSQLSEMWDRCPRGSGPDLPSAWTLPGGFFWPQECATPDLGVGVTGGRC